MLQTVKRPLSKGGALTAILPMTPSFVPVMVMETIVLATAVPALAAARKMHLARAIVVTWPILVAARLPSHRYVIRRLPVPFAAKHDLSYCPNPKLGQFF